MTMTRQTVCAIAITALAGCAQKSEVKKDEPPVASAPPEAAPAQPAAQVEQPAVSKEPTCEAIRVHFPLDSSEIQPEDRSMLENAGECLRKDHALHVTIEGNADERGTEEYNLALGDRRAHAVAKYLKSLGATDKQMKTVSYGKTNPECTEHNESCWSQNRRAAVKPHSR
jgi:peptidoglycan-associated lipoprotein